jgi:hypothetical protein
MVPETMIYILMAGKHGDMLFGHKGQTKTNERIFQS